MNKLFSANQLIEMSTVLITIIGTYLVAKYQIINPNKTSIRQQQLEKVYLPLYKLIMKPIAYSVHKHSSIKTKDILEKTSVIIDENFLFIYPDLLNAYFKLLDKFDNAENTDDAYDSFCNMIIYDYEKLKRYLGYPSGSYKDFFFRIDTASKLKEILSWISIPLIFSPVAFAISNNFNNFSFFKFSAIFCLILFFLSKSNDLLTSLQRRK